MDFAVPFSPRTSTPPTSGEIVVRTSASAMSSEPTTAENGVLAPYRSRRSLPAACPRPAVPRGRSSAPFSGTAAGRGGRPDFLDRGHSGGTAPDSHRIPPPHRLDDVIRHRSSYGRGVIEVVGIGATWLESLAEPARHLHQRRRGRARQAAAPLTCCRRSPVSEAASWPSPLREALPQLVAGHRGPAGGGRLAVGDPLVAGIGSTLIEMLGAARRADPPRGVLGRPGPRPDGLGSGEFRRGPDSGRGRRRGLARYLAPGRRLIISVP